MRFTCIRRIMPCEREREGVMCISLVEIPADSIFLLFAVHCSGAGLKPITFSSSGCAAPLLHRSSIPGMLRFVYADQIRDIIFGMRGGDSRGKLLTTEQ
jgi:hypothetical protein